MREKINSGRVHKALSTEQRDAGAKHSESQQVSGRGDAKGKTRCID